jgi:aspartate ammonia-lyase
MNVYTPLIIFNITHSITIMADGCTNFRRFLVEGTNPNPQRIKEYVDRLLMLVTALSPVIGYDKASKIAHYALDKDLTLKQAALELGFVSEDQFDRVVDPAKMVQPLRRNIQLNDLSPSKWFRARWPTRAQAMADCLATTCALRSSGAAKTCCA